MIPETAALMERIKTEGAFNVLAEILADTSELILRLDNKVGGNDAPDTLAKRNAMGGGESLCDSLIEAMTRLPSEGVAGAMVHLVMASDPKADATVRIYPLILPMPPRPPKSQSSTRISTTTPTTPPSPAPPYRP